MSDMLETMEEIGKLRDKIEELEQKLEKLEKIIILDSEIAEETCAETIIECIISQSDSNKDKIEALENEIEDMKVIWIEFKKQYDKEIAELKEQLEGKADMEIVYEDFAIKHFQIKEVLWELGKALLGKNIIGVSFYRDMKEKLDGENRFEGDRMVEQLPSGAEPVRETHSSEVQEATDSKPSLITSGPLKGLPIWKQAQREDVPEGQTGKPLIEGQFGLYEHVWVAREDLKWLLYHIGDEYTYDGKWDELKEKYLSEEKDE